MRRTIFIVVGVIGFVLLFNAGRILGMFGMGKTELPESYTSLVENEAWKAAGADSAVSLSTEIIEELEDAFGETEKFYYLDLPGYSVFTTTLKEPELCVLLTRQEETETFLGYAYSETLNAATCIDRTLESILASPLVEGINEPIVVKDESDQTFTGKMCQAEVENQEYFLYTAAVQKNGVTVVVTLFEKKETRFFRERVLAATDAFVTSNSYIPGSTSWIPFHSGS
ncbi:MAG: hypothetical protein Q4B26_00375 [Eubacteriales bacterium]|nr:hypothetical protein [Eubacteriales bacterium]